MSSEASEAAYESGGVLVRGVCWNGWTKLPPVRDACPLPVVATDMCDVPLADRACVNLLPAGPLPGAWRSVADRLKLTSRADRTPLPDDS